MKKLLVALAICALAAPAALANPVMDASGAVLSPHLGGWTPGGAGTLHVFWDFNADEVENTSAAGYPDAYQANPTEADPLEITPGDQVATAGFSSESGVVYANGAFTSSAAMAIRLKIDNYDKPNAMKEIWVDLGGVFAGVEPVALLAVDGGATFTYEWLLDQGGPSQAADFGVRIYPNPRYEEIEFSLLPVGGATADVTGVMLDWIHVDTICIPAPGALLLGGLGTCLVGWLRRRRAV